MLDRKKENNTVCSSINSPSNLVNNVFASVLFLLNFRSFPDFVSKSSEHCWGDFFTRWWESEEEWFWWFKNFSKLKTAFCEYWTSLKTKISMICVSKEYEIKIKMEQKQWLQLIIAFLFCCWVELNFGGREYKFSGTGWMNKFLVGGETPPSRQYENSV